MVLGGPPNAPAMAVAIPSPNKVRFKPGSSIKFFSATLLMAYISPTCSIMGATATGNINNIASQLNVGVVNLGNAIHAASEIAVKSTFPKIIATIYPTTIPIKIGTSLITPLAKITTPMAVNKATTASTQFSLAMFTPTGASDKPITIITGPTTTEGNNRSIKVMPLALTNADTIPYTKPTAINPESVPDKPYSSVALIMGAIKAKLLPRKIGTFPLVIR